MGREGGGQNLVVFGRGCDIFFGVGVTYSVFAATNDTTSLTYSRLLMRPRRSRLVEAGRPLGSSRFSFKLRINCFNLKRSKSRMLMYALIYMRYWNLRLENQSGKN